MEEKLRKELLRDARYYLACNICGQDRYVEAQEMHLTNQQEFLAYVIYLFSYRFFKVHI
jgi:hypothetical protein